MSILDDVISQDFYDPLFNLRGAEDYKQFENAFFKGFPDWIETIEDIIAEGDKVWVRFIATGTHKGELMGTPPTDVHVTGTGISICIIDGGKIIEIWDNSDALGMWQQLGVIPPIGQGN